MIKVKTIQLTSGRGPIECCWVVAEILKIILSNASKLGFNAKVLHREEGPEHGTLVSVILQVQGLQIETFIKEWVGTIQWIGKSKFRKSCKRNNWFIGVNEILAGNESVIIRDEDLKCNTMRSGGPGGQHVNKVETAVRLIHLPSGVTVNVSKNRSQVLNKKLAKEKLIEIMSEKNIKAIQNQKELKCRNHLELERGNPSKVFSGLNFVLVKKNTGKIARKRIIIND